MLETVYLLPSPTKTKRNNAYLSSFHGLIRERKKELPILLPASLIRTALLPSFTTTASFLASDKREYFFPIFGLGVCGPLSSTGIDCGTER